MHRSGPRKREAKGIALENLSRAGADPLPGSYLCRIERAMPQTLLLFGFCFESHIYFLNINLHPAKPAKCGI